LTEAQQFLFECAKQACVVTVEIHAQSLRADLAASLMDPSRKFKAMVDRAQVCDTFDDVFAQIVESVRREANAQPAN